MILFFVVFLLAEGILSYRRQPDISMEQQAGFHVKDCYDVRDRL